MIIYLIFSIERKDAERMSPRNIFFILGLLPLAAIAFAKFYLEDVQLLEPCPYCMLQRGVMLLFTAVFWFSAIFVGRGSQIFSKLSSLLFIIVGALGLFISGKHIYLQLNPTDSLGCTQTTLAITEVFDYQIVKDLLMRGGDCSVIDWTFLGLTIPMWTAMATLFFALIGILVNRYAKRSGRMRSRLH